MAAKVTTNETGSDGCLEEGLKVSEEQEVQNFRDNVVAALATELESQEPNETFLKVLQQAVMEEGLDFQLLLREAREELGLE